MIQTGAWSLAPVFPRTRLLTPPETNREARPGSQQQVVQQHPLVGFPTAPEVVPEHSKGSGPLPPNAGQYLDDHGVEHSLGSDDVNDYLREITAKDFRTWAAKNLAALALRDFDAYDSAAKGKKNVLRVIEPVAKMLGNIPSICRKCYIHPAIFEGYLDTILEGIKDHADESLMIKHLD